MRALFLLTRFPARLNTLSEGIDGMVWQDIFWQEDSDVERTAGFSSTTVKVSALGP